MHDRTLQVAERLDRIESGESGADRSLALLREALEQHAERIQLESRGMEGVAAGGRPAPQPQ
ncbi:MAG: hypothetical protein IPG75_20580 [Gemmatimonadetes bacterium]|nr:hypothetical protein [Gemmatimonadota bacterium]